MEERKYSQWFYLAREACFLFLALTSGVVIYKAAESAIPIDNFAVLTIISALCAFGFYLAVDGPVGEILPWFVKKWTSPAWNESKPEERNFFVAGGFVAILLLLITGSVSFVSSYLIADFIAPPPDGSKMIAAISNEAERAERQNGTLLNELERLRGTETERIRNATERGRNAVERAIDSRPDLAEHWRSGNQWVRKTWKTKSYRAAIAKAKRDSAAWVDAERQRVANLEERFATAVSDTTKSAVLAGLVDIARNDQNRAMWTSRNWAKVLIFLDIILVIGAVAFSWLFAKDENLYGKVVYEGVFTPAAAINAFRRGLSQTPLQWFHRYIAPLDVIPAAVYAGTTERNGIEHGTERNAERLNGTERNGTPDNKPAEQNGGGIEKAWKDMNDSERKQMKKWLKELHAKGKTYGEISEITGMAKGGTMFRLINEKS